MRSRPLAIVVTATVILSLLAGPAAAARPARDPGRAAERALLEQLDPAARVTRDRVSGAVRSLRGGRGPLASARSLGSPSTPAAAARAFAGRYGTVFGVSAPGRELRVADVSRTDGAGTYVRLQQQIDGVPVLGGDLVVVVDGRQNVRAARGEATRDRAVDTRARISPSTAMRAAREAVARATGAPIARLRAATPTRWILDPRLLDAPGLPYARLVWRTSVRDAIGAIDWFVAVDARTGDVALRFDQRPSGVPADAAQRICNQNNQRESVRDRLPCTDAGKEVEPYTGDELTAEESTEAAYDFYRLRFGYDLASQLSGTPGGKLVSTVVYCPNVAGGGCPYLNAFWNGSQMVYGKDFATADDVVGHELTHGVTERASSLFYYMQSGAINEALSDIFGEAIDLTDDLPFDSDGEADRWKIGEDLPNSIGVIRNMKNPTAFGHPDTMDSSFWDDDPSETDSGGVHSNSGVANRAFYLMVEGPTPLDADRDVALDQAIALWFLASQTLLTSGSDYADLADALQIACDQLAAGPSGAIKDKDGNASTDIVAGDCGPSGAVQAALATTHMRWSDRTTGVPPVAMCSDPDATPAFLLADAIDASGTGWTFDLSGDRRWFTQDWYALPDVTADPGTEDPWALIGEDLARTADRRIKRTNAVSIPESGRPVFLWFRHAFGFDDGSEDLDPNNRAYDGGVVEVSANGGPWVDIRSLFLRGGPTRTIFKGDTNPLKGRIAYGAESGGFVTARANLSGYPGLGFAGKNVKLSFRIGTDSTYAGEGWFIDDVRIYQCVNNADSLTPAVYGLSTEICCAGAVGADGRLRIILRASATMGVEWGTGVTSVRVGAGPEKPVAGQFGLGGLSWNAEVPLLPSDQVQHIKVTVTDENGDAGSATIDDRFRAFQDPTFSYNSGWTSRSRSSAWGGTVRSASQAGRTATTTFTGHSVMVVLSSGPDKGKARVCLDADCRVVDTYSGKPIPRRFLASWNLIDDASHTLTVTALGKKNAQSKGKTIELDGIAVLQD